MKKLKKSSKNSEMNSSKLILLAKLRRPVHISYISKYLLKSSMFETEKVINEMIDENLFEESKYGKGYYVVKSK
jgi:hypothetical protein